MNDTLERHRRMVRRIHQECLNRGELATLPAIVSDDDSGVSGERGPDGFASTLRGLRAGFADLLPAPPVPA